MAMERLRRALLRAGALAVLTLGAGTMAGCIHLFPTEPGDDRVELTVRSGEVWFHWCGNRSAQEGLRISFRDEPRGGDVRVAYEGAGSFVLEPGDEFAVAAPPQGLRATAASVSMPVTDELDRVFVSNGDGPSNAEGIRSVFNVDNIEELEGVWLRIDGTTAGTPCSNETGDGAAHPSERQGRIGPPARASVGVS